MPNQKSHTSHSSTSLQTILHSVNCLHTISHGYIFHITPSIYKGFFNFSQTSIAATHHFSPQNNTITLHDDKNPKKLSQHNEHLDEKIHYKMTKTTNLKWIGWDSVVLRQSERDGRLGRHRSERDGQCGLRQSTARMAGGSSFGGS